MFTEHNRARNCGTISEIDWDGSLSSRWCVVVLLLKILYLLLTCKTHTQELFIHHHIMCESHFPLSLLLLLYKCVQILILLTVCGVRRLWDIIDRLFRVHIVRRFKFNIKMHENVHEREACNNKRHVWCTINTYKHKTFSCKSL